MNLTYISAIDRRSFVEVALTFIRLPQIWAILLKQCFEGSVIVLRNLKLSIVLKRWLNCSKLIFIEIRTTDCDATKRKNLI
ncbi:hypothetical protein T02_15242 [Trichinella nativa]|uniref:Uncharacterized protein n=1 Tax=Trichinella nativa TaxID=6335 RepID=A0A0V1LJT5_9BILA|nr:hypothetical protein T02_15242 [Trichinella nativa]